MIFAVFFFVMSSACAFLAVSEGGAAWLFLWPATSFAILGAAYLGLGPRVFGKRPDGTSSVVATIVLLPYLAPLRTLWTLLRARNDRQPHVELVPALSMAHHAHHVPAWPAIVIGRRLRAHEFPQGITCVVDLTCEFENESKGASIAHYISLPILDAYVPPADGLFDLVRRIRDTGGADGGADGGVVYVHCAEGRGRTALVACALLLARGDAGNVDEAISFVRAKRLVILSGPQRRLLRATEAQLVAMARSTGAAK